MGWIVSIPQGALVYHEPPPLNMGNPGFPFVVRFDGFIRLLGLCRGHVLTESVDTQESVFCENIPQLLKRKRPSDPPSQIF